MTEFLTLEEIRERDERADARSVGMLAGFIAGLTVLSLLAIGVFA